MYAMDRAVHTEHSSAPRRARREGWRHRLPAPMSSPAAPDDRAEMVGGEPEPTDFAD